MAPTVIITGGNRGIGRALTICFLDVGYNVVVGARQHREVETLAPERVKFVEMDVRNEADHVRLTDIAVAEFGGVDCYVNNAGYSEWRPIAEIDAEFLDDLISTNLKGAFWGCKAAATSLQSGGVIVNISSMAAKRGSANNSAYSASKFGMNGLTQSLAKELGPRGIRVNALCPVLVKTDGLMEALATKWAPGKDGPDEFLANFNAANTALGRLPTGEEVGEMAVFLSSSKASAITGQCINVDCGVFPQ